MTPRPNVFLKLFFFYHMALETKFSDILIILLVCLNGVTSFARNISFEIQSYLVLMYESFFFCLFIFFTSSNYLVLKQHHLNRTSLHAIPQFASDTKESFKYNSIEATCVPYIGLNINHEERASSFLWVKSWTWYAIVVSLWSKETHNWISSNDFFLVSPLSHALGRFVAQKIVFLTTYEESFYLQCLQLFWFNKWLIARESDKARQFKRLKLVIALW